VRQAGRGQKEEYSMTRERLGQPSLPEAFSEVLSDLADLFRKELRLARAELSTNVSTKLRGGIWLGLASLFGISAFALVLGGLVSWITTLDVPLHMAFLIVAAGIGLLAILAYLVGRKEAQSELAPSRTISQIKQDIETTKEQLT
jgi:Putative Actinobacterial Holin-X, holin superfamily III